MKNSESKNPIYDKPNSYPSWAPRIWTGIRPRDYWNFLSENNFNIHPSRYPMTALIGIWAMLNTCLATIQKVAKGDKIEGTEIVEPPIFIIGHWRSGTTMLHELMALDENLAYPTNFDSFVPHHFLISSPVVRPLIQLLLPNKRPMDNMTLQVDSPQEDDFALMLLGAPSHYWRMGFPQNDNEYFKFLDAGNLSNDQLDSLESEIKYFFKALTLKYGKRLVLKSPPHTGRIKQLLQWFPGAKFVHISRHPYDIVPSTMRFWKITDDVHAFQKKRYSDDQLFEYVNKCQKVLYHAYNRDKSLLHDDQIVEVTFEQLTSQPSQTIRKIYERLKIGGVESAVESTEQYFSQRKDHKKNRHEINRLIEKIDVEWSDYMDQFGFAKLVQTDKSTHVA